MNHVISPQEAIELLTTQQERYGFIDVRAESEFKEGCIEGFLNAPILNDEERHLVGTCYKAKGNEAATALGYTLTEPHKQSRVQAWCAAKKTAGLVVCCWRGGSRSRIACEWLNEVGITTYRVQGGYKALRAQLREALLRIPSLVVLAGATGTGKTLMLRAWNGPKVDFEKLANHRGSAFGRLGEQPTQQTFEHRLALAFMNSPAKILVEDESRLIGRCELAKEIKDKMYDSPVVMLNASLQERTRITFEEYVAEPLRAGKNPEHVANHLIKAMNNIQRKLGGVRHRELMSALNIALDKGDDLAAHTLWIEPLLSEYYDPQYLHAFHSRPRDIVFQGERDQVISFLNEYFADEFGVT